MSYVVAVKRSARQASAAAGEWVRDRGPRRTFDSKRAAREWARGLGDEQTVWIQNAHPADDSPADGYLVARRVPFWVSREEDPPGVQATLPR
ncbi:MAG: hypothetical protein ABEJ05_03650 [Haloglomus sp.]